MSTSNTDKEIIRILKSSVVLILHENAKTIQPKTLQTIFRILYLDDRDFMRKGVSAATRYCTNYADDLKKAKEEITYFNTVNTILKDFIKNTASELTNEQIRLGGNTILYLCGLYEEINNKNEITNITENINLI